MNPFLSWRRSDGRDGSLGLHTLRFQWYKERGHKTSGQPDLRGVFTRRTSSTPENLLGENSVPDQLKEYEEINKVRAKLQKPRKSGGGENRHENSRGRGRGFYSNNREGFSNRGSGSHQGSGFGNYNNNNNFQRGGRPSRPGYPQQRRVYGQNSQNNQEQGGQRGQKNA